MRFPARHRPDRRPVGHPADVLTAVLAWLAAVAVCVAAVLVGQSVRTAPRPRASPRLGRPLVDVPRLPHPAAHRRHRPRASPGASSRNCCLREHHRPRWKYPRRFLASRCCCYLYISHLNLYSATDPHLLSAGQLQWMDYELLLPALRPLLLCNGLPPSTVDRLIQDAQHDLYPPAFPPSTIIHIAYASKCL